MNVDAALTPVESWKPTDRAVMTLKETGRVLCIGQSKVFDLINRVFPAGVRERIG